MAGTGRQEHHASAAGISTRAHTLKSRPTSPSGRASVLVTYSGRATEPASIAVWNRVKPAAASSIDRVTRLAATAGRGGTGVVPSTSSGVPG